ncbi:MAG: AbrB family transcriptional regulator [Anaerolineae bacterium]
MKTGIREMVRYAIDELREEELAEVLDFIHYLRWRQEETDQSWFWTDEWQARYQEAKADLAAGRYKDFEDVEELLAELKR